MNSKIFKLAIIQLFIFLAFSPGCINKYKIAHGIDHQHWIDETGPWNIHLVTVDLVSPQVKVSAFKANHIIRSKAKTSEMVRDESENGRNVVAAVNADFFKTDGKPVGMCVQGGEIVTPPATHPVFGITNQGTPFIENVKLYATVFAKADSHMLAINTRKLDTICLFNHFYGDSLSLQSEEHAYEIRTLDDWRTNKVVRTVIVDIDSINAQSIPRSGALLVSASEKILGAIGDTLRVLLSLSPLSVPVDQAVGGIPRIVRDGKVSVEWKQNDFNLTRHPRTAVGFSRDKRRLFLVTVDGRQPGYSEGMTLTELANFMIDIGSYQALNLDGGGSTTMVISGEVVNRPSDITGERSVSNALFISTIAK